MTWFVLALLASLIFAIVNIIDDNLVAHVYPDSGFAMIISGLFSIVPVILTVVFPIDVYNIKMATVVVALLGGMLFQTSLLFYFEAFKHEKPSVVIALFSIAPAFVPFIAFLIVDERLYVMQYLGLGIVLVASVAITTTSFRRIGRSPVLGLMLLTALILAISMVLQKYAYNKADFWTCFVVYSSGMVLASLCKLAFSKSGRRFIGQLRQSWDRALLFAAVAETLSLVAYFIYSMAISRGPVSLVVVLSAVQPIYVLLIGILLFPFWPKFFREQLDQSVLRKVICMLMMLGGLYLVRVNGV